jgi:parvulin-like peptidyl-prolyl isomerase
MFRIARTGLFTLIVLGFAAVVNGQDTPSPKGATLPAAGAAPADRGQLIPGANDVIATVTSRNQTTKLTRGELVAILRNFSLPAGEEPESIYHQAVDILVSETLVNHFLARQNVPVAPNKVEEQIDLIRQQIKREGQDLPNFLSMTGSSMDELRKKIESRIRWMEYYKSKGTDGELRKYLNVHRDRFSGTQVRASHILLKVDTKAGAAEKEKVKQKLIGIRNEILQNQLNFAEAANKYSEDPGNEGGAGGSLDWFPIEGVVVDEFAVPAFKLKKGEISQPVETPYGLHLIQVTDRKEGKLPDFEQYRVGILNAYATDLQKELVTAEKRDAKIEVKPMPKDLFTPQPGATTTPAPAAAGAGAIAPKP